MKDLWGDDQQQLQVPRSAIGNLSKEFLIPPFSVIDMRSGDWRTRKHAWIHLGIQSELGRDATTSGSKMPEYRIDENGKFARGDLHSCSTSDSSTSIFDPVLCELVYRWYSAPSARVLDPFAGGSVRGITAAYLDRIYTGIDLSAEQVQANYTQVKEPYCSRVGWVQGDSRYIKNFTSGWYDLIFTCPPYYDLEQYSSDPADLSNARTYQEFILAYNHIIDCSCKVLKADRFACVVVGNIRDQEGYLHNLVDDTVHAFKCAGLHYYNDAVLITPTGSLQVRAGGTFRASRKLGRTHQMLLVFVKGDWRKAVQYCGAVENDLSLNTAH